ncbi:YfaA protien [Geomicrobium sp. JCM 19037]|uniref:YpmS family protein n=1 Tax=Geomicrobium sp. JCM 19037 TaxID=1460634 RepID=UPI00045F260E|nr:YpmS family protein [Geomicrobium sp. JCM 19037]GAK05220.1 YfaA protien [Geomicrobium sp. JCM 19037]
MKWRWAFFILLGLQALAVIVLAIMLTSGSSGDVVPEREQMSVGEPLFTVETSVARINDYIDEASDDQFQLHADDGNYVFTNEYELFGLNIDIQMQLQPEITEAGNIRLYEDGLSIGSLSLPASAVLTLISEQADLPNWIHVNPDEGFIDIRVNEIDTGEGLGLRAAELSDEGTITIEALVIEP